MSPTKEGPGKDSHKRWPNLMKMLAEGITLWSKDVAKSAESVAYAMSLALNKPVSAEWVRRAMMIVAENAWIVEAKVRSMWKNVKDNIQNIASSSIKESKKIERWLKLSYKEIKKSATSVAYAMSLAFGKSVSASDVNREFQKIADSAWVLEDRVRKMGKNIKDNMEEIWKSIVRQWDKHMPELLSLYAKWLKESEEMFARNALKVKDAIEKSIGKITSFDKIFEGMKEMWKSAKSAFSEIEKGIVWKEKLISSLEGQITSLWNKLEDIAKKQTALSTKWNNDVATRAVKIQDELMSLRAEMKVEEEDTSWIEGRIKLLEKELTVATAYVSDATIISARKELEKTETQKIIDRIQSRELELQEQKKSIQEEISLKKDSIESEKVLYASLIDQKKELDKQYFALFGQQINIQTDSVDQLIDKMARLAAVASTQSSIWSNIATTWTRAAWWWVSPGRTYKVNEHKQEYFAPNKWGHIVNNWGEWWWSINISFWAVTVNGPWDENRLAEKIRKVMIDVNSNRALWYAI